MSNAESVVITIFGLGEAGSLIAADLAANGAEVHGFDPAGVPTPPGITRHDSPAGAVRGASLIMAITAAADAQAAIAQAWDRISRGTVYADLSTAPPAFKQDLSDTATLRGLPFVDVALMAGVPGRGIATPSLASGSGARLYATVISGLGGDVEVLGENPGDAATRKLLRSVVMKGLASAVFEGLEGATRLGLEDWFWDHIVDQVERADGKLLERLVKGTTLHADRRSIEMDSAAALLESVGIDPIMSRATARQIRVVGKVEDDSTSSPADAGLVSDEDRRA
ncbi:MAG: DUF1932 domain-containing protein [Acidimicrobiia bacterium]